MSSAAVRFVLPQDYGSPDGDVPGTRSRRHSSPGDSRRGSGAELEESAYAEDANMVSAAPHPKYCVHSLGGGSLFQIELSISSQEIETNVAFMTAIVMLNISHSVVLQSCSIY